MGATARGVTNIGGDRNYKLELVDKTMIDKAINYWSQLQPYRSERLRCKNYTYGRQWKDWIDTEDGRRIPEEQYIREQGSAPLKNNLIRRIVRNVVGVFRNNYKLPTFSDLTEEMQQLYKRTVNENCLSEIFSRVMEEYLIGGLAVVRKRFSLEGGGKVLTEMVRPDSFFFNTDATDPRGWDIHTIGEIHEVSRSRGMETVREKVFEVWWLEEGEWRYLFSREDGEVISRGLSPFPTGGHPYVMKAYPFLDGEIHSFVADCIDQQRYINRLITLNDWIIRASAKGVLLFPENAIPDDLDLEDIAAQWSQYNGVIRYKAKTGVPMPQQVATNSTNIGIGELLNVQLKMMEDVSGINAALQGQLTSGSISGTLYEQQTRHALTGLTDILEGYRQFMTDCARKDIEFLGLVG